MEKYNIDLKCSNCGAVNWITGIPTGTLVQDYIENKKCRNCNCLIIKPKEEKKEK